ncbi:DUF962 domain-containing protein [Mucilaginibacter achroorhodeus]|uniref:DUF962 domain-containing protein n=1 Tax=Mucilaginibacter achroorhodeus TaxID=2599294 RepID=A0A563U8T8_9SPHI|nr:Mpo1-like protein [Mucilaginibacter achroorhodeus]TWR27744.1 DUF962 domain-containing protein [Mucilaginibacter achroorhodeus]
MGKQHHKYSTPAKPKQEDLRPVELIFARLDASHQNPTNLLLHYICVPLMVLGILGMAWAMPFPEIGFLKAYQGYFNWASFVIAVAVYYYLKQSPMLSYLMLFLMFGFSYLIIQFETWEKAGGPPLGLISVGVLMLSLVGQYIGGKIEGKEQSFNDDSKLFYVTPLWVMYRLARKIKLKY